MTDDQMITRLLVREGSTYAEHPSDRGVCSKYGITRALLSDVRGQAVTCEDVKGLTDTEARKIYLERFLTRFDMVPDWRLRELLFDAAVHHGPGRPIKWLQQALKVEDDGVIGPETLAALTLANLVPVYRGVLQRRLSFLGRLISEQPSQYIFAAGWLNRIGEFI